MISNKKHTEDGFVVWHMKKTIDGKIYGLSVAYSKKDDRDYVAYKLIAARVMFKRTTERLEK